MKSIHAFEDFNIGIQINSTMFFDGPKTNKVRGVSPVLMLKSILQVRVINRGIFFIPLQDFVVSAKLIPALHTALNLVWFVASPKPAVVEYPGDFSISHQ